MTWTDKGLHLTYREPGYELRGFVSDDEPYLVVVRGRPIHSGPETGEAIPYGDVRFARAVEAMLRRARAIRVEWQDGGVDGPRVPVDLGRVWSGSVLPAGRSPVRWVRVPNTDKIAVVYQEIDATNHLIREVGLDLAGVVIHRCPDERFDGGEHGLDNPPSLDDAMDISREEFEEQWDRDAPLSPVALRAPWTHDADLRTRSAVNPTHLRLALEYEGHGCVIADWYLEISPDGEISRHIGLDPDGQVVYRCDAGSFGVWNDEFFDLPRYAESEAEWRDLIAEGNGVWVSAEEFDRNWILGRLPPGWWPGKTDR